MKYLGPLIFLFKIFAFAQGAPSPTPPPSLSPSQIQQAQEAGTATGTAVGNTVSTAAQDGRNTQNTEYNTLLRSSVDSMMNGQQGEATSVYMSNSLTAAAAPYAADCSQATTEGIEACAAGSVLAGMSGQMQTSTPTFAGAINQAWSNVCHFSHNGCTNPPNNPYLGVIPPAPTSPAPSLPEIIQTLQDRGYNVNPRTGMVTLRDGTIINVNDRNSVAKALGESGQKSIQRLLNNMQKDISDRFSKISAAKYMKLIGLGNMKDLSQKVAEYLAGEGKNKNQEGPQTSRFYNRLPEKINQPVNIADLVKSLDGTPIGVAAADIFKMVKKRYDLKASEKFFLLPDGKILSPQKLRK